MMELGAVMVGEHQSCAFITLLYLFLVIYYS